MKKVKTTVIVFLLVVLALHVQKSWDWNEKVEDKVLISKEKLGEVRKKVDSVVTDTVYLEKKIKGTSERSKVKIVVDSAYKKEYENAIKENDSLKAMNLFLESIAINDYKELMVDNKDINITGNIKVRGKLLEYDIKYLIKSDTITYKPEVVSSHPRLTLLPGLELMAPIDPLSTTQPALNIKLGFQNKKGNILMFGYDTQKRVTIGYYPSIRLIK